MESTVWKPNVEISPNCPRCGSSNTKFCYYNNYSLTQPRYFCKGCRRYWTKGGSLRNVPVGGGCRKNRRCNHNNKTLRSAQTIDGVISKNSTFGHSSDPRRRTNSSSSSSSVVNDAPNIDLALLYANFLNQKPSINSSEAFERQPDNDQIQMQSTVFYPNSIENSSQVVGPSALPQEIDVSRCLNNLPESHFSHEVDHNNQTYFCGFSDFMQQKNQKDKIDLQYCSSSHTHYDDAMKNFELPPLPGEEELLGSQHDDHIRWSNSDEMMVNHAFQAPLFGPEESAHHDHADLLIGNWSPFMDFPRDHASFSRP